MRYTKLFLLLLFLSGCRSYLASKLHPNLSKQPEGSNRVFQDTIEFPDVSRSSDLPSSLPPRSLADGEPANYWNLTLSEAIQLGLSNGPILRRVGGAVLSSPQQLATVFDPAIAQSQPRIGEEAALAAFDPFFSQSVTFGGSDLPFNNSNLGGGAFQVQSDLFRLETALSKTTATGAQFNINTFTQHDNSDAPSNLFPHAWTNGISLSARQPLLQGAGVTFNRIAGPTGQPDVGLTPGVLLARINTDISVTQFEIGVRDFVDQVEEAYWALYESYRIADANRAARDAAQETWKVSKTRFEAGLVGGAADQEAQAREQLFAFKQQVLVSMDGNSSNGQTQNGVFPSERRLRELLGLPVNDGRLIRPSEEPTEVPVVYDWDSSLCIALQRRPEIRQQLWRIKQRELEIRAAKNFLKPRLDLIGSVRSAGLGDDLIGGTGPFSNAFDELYSMDNYDLSAGLELSAPVGFRRAIAGVRHANLNLCRDRSILNEQERAISHELGEAISDVGSAYRNIQLSYSRLVAAEQVVNSREAAYQAGKSSIDALLESQRRLAQSRTDYFRVRVGYQLSIKNVQLRKGTLLNYNGIYLSEAASCPEARLAATHKTLRNNQFDYRIVKPEVISRGIYPQSLLSP